MYGIEETKDVLKFAFAIGEAFGESFEDGKLTWTDSANFVPVLQTAWAAFKGLEDVPKELLDLDDQEKDDLLAWAKTEFDLADDELEERVERALEIAFAIFDYINDYYLKPPEEESPIEG